jgi:hypothetical protein
VRSERRPPERALKIITALALAVASALTIRATVAARQACWGDVVILPREPRGEPKHHDFQEIAAQGPVHRQGMGPDSGDVLLEDVSVHYDVVAFEGDERVGRVYTNYAVRRISIPSTCSMSGMPDYPPFFADPPYALFHDRARDVYRVTSADGPTRMDAIDFRRIPRPGHVIVSPRLRQANSLALVLGMVSLGFGWRRGPRWILAALSLAALAALLSCTGGERGAAPSGSSPSPATPQATPHL